MLEPSDDSARGYALFLGELTNATFAIGIKNPELFPLGAGHEKIRSPPVGLRFNVCNLTARLRSIDKYSLLAVQKNVGRLVEQAEPQRSEPPEALQGAS